MSSSARLSAPAHDAEARPRNRRLGTGGDASSRSTSLLRTTPSPSPSRGASPIPPTRIGPDPRSPSRATPGRSNTTDSSILSKSWLDGQWKPSWASVQEFATTLLGGVDTPGDSSGSNGKGTNQKKAMHRASVGTPRNNQPSAWGPEPPGKSDRPRIEDVAAGSLAEREAAYKARKTASILESHDGVNGGLDVAGKYKRRNSDEDSREHSAHPEVEDQLVYVHHVQPSDTYAGIILRYRCREDAFRKANGLWSRDNIQVREWLALPVDACEVKGRPCEGPSYFAKEVDLVATTPSVTPGTPTAKSNIRPLHDESFAPSPNGIATGGPKHDGEKPWTHVRWVNLDNCRGPVEIARVSRNAMGYFPPRRKKSLHTTSTLSTPRGSFDVPSISLSSDIVESPGSLSSRRQSLLAHRPHVTSMYASSAPTPSRSRVGSDNDDARPAWMRRPGGVGTLNRNVRAPGPDKDYFNSWAKKHLPGLNIDNLPSMAVMGSETARFGFTNDEAAAIVESPFVEGCDATSSSNQGTGLDKAAMAVETWLRGAWAKRPNTPILGPHRARPFAESEPDLIELEDAPSEDGHTGSGLLDQGTSGPLNSTYGSSSRIDADGSQLRGRLHPRGNSAITKDKKAD